MHRGKSENEKRKRSGGGSAGKKRVILFGAAALFFAVMAWFLWLLYSATNGLSVTYYTLDTGKLESTLRIVQLSDLHSHESGTDNEKLISAIRELEPDLIFCTGDMLNADDPDSEKLQRLLRELNGIASVYYSLGNHEIAYMSSRGSAELGQEIADTGTVFLNGTWEDMTLPGVGSLRVGGMYGYAFCPEGMSEEEFARERTARFLMEYEDTDALRLLLVHRPDSFYFGDARERWHVDLIFSGHLHGGQVRLPVLGGVYGGDLGWFSEYLDGLHTMGNCRMVISRGLGSSPDKIPRWNNIPEILVMDLK
ncbi:MAG: metallophosphoesterase [Fusicatenibacter sp.]